MCKAFSSLLLLAILLATIAPLLALSPQSLPACCRADGKHHCAAMMTIHLDGVGFRAQMPPCPYLQHPAVAPAHSALQVERATLSVTSTFSKLDAPSCDTVVVASHYSVPQRGPPLSTLA